MRRKSKSGNVTKRASAGGNEANGPLLKMAFELRIESMLQVGCGEIGTRYNSSSISFLRRTDGGK